MNEFVDAISGLLVASGVGSPWASTGVSVQNGIRRDTGAPTILLLRQTGGTALPFDTSEEYGFQVLLDSETVSGARQVSRDVYNLLHDLRAAVVSGYSALWVRAVAPPQDVGLGLGAADRFVVSTNYTARLLR